MVFAMIEVKIDNVRILATQCMKWGRFEVPGIIPGQLLLICVSNFNFMQGPFTVLCILAIVSRGEITFGSLRIVALTIPLLVNER